ncbi:hypothetical protein [Salsuginibacillus kocurii]|uniref:hypothetical protein n=1 Tax=Salsuginibacillus kocurii TaxID=427078 RepID=UPI00038296B6|nr:hypothetical protein [Salsuginibacillus kocurii]
MGKSTIVWSTLAAGVAGTTLYLLRNDEQREKVVHNSKRWLATVRGSRKEEEDEYLRDKIGHSDPLDVADNKMVDEGAMYSVLHYNEKQENDEHAFEPTEEGAERPKH